MPEGTMLWESFDENPNANTDPPPVGAPEGHATDQVNNIARHDKAAIAEIGNAIWPDGSLGLTNSAQATFDMIWPIGSIRMWNSTDLSGLVPTGVTATWIALTDFDGAFPIGVDGSHPLLTKVGTDFLLKNGVTEEFAAGAHNHTFTSDADGSHSHTATGAAGAHTHGALTGGTAADLPAHTHKMFIDTELNLSGSNPSLGVADQVYRAIDNPNDGNAKYDMHGGAPAATAGDTGSAGTGSTHNHSISSDGDHTHSVASGGSTHSHAGTTDTGGGGTPATLTVTGDVDLPRVGVYFVQRSA